MGLFVTPRIFSHLQENIFAAKAKMLDNLNVNVNIHCFVTF